MWFALGGGGGRGREGFAERAWLRGLVFRRAESAREVVMGVLRWVVLVLVVFVGGCETVVSDHLVGKLAEDEVTAKFVGKWRWDDEEVAISAVGPGELEARSKDGEVRKVWVTGNGAYLFVQRETEDEAVKGDGKGHRPYEFYMAAVAQNEDPGYLVLFVANPLVFSDAVKRGVLKGEVLEVASKGPPGPDGEARSRHERTVVWVKGDKGAWDRFVEPGRVAEEFVLQAPVVMVRVK
jgi:hypothetical protein